ncbi:glycosyltransferase family 2 protein [Micromonospora carbonacea]|uniref:glycosyltransferase family 2 protein n=1 Tax=Micromonospora carbonacea TaxID=47853 RepID=UPI003D7113D7
MTSGRPRVATVTVTTNESKWLRRCLGALVDSDTEGFDLDVHLIDNASTDGSAELVAREFPSVKITRNPTNLGFAGANNVGIRAALAAGADYVFLVNPDTWTPPRLVRAMVEFAERWPEYGIVGPLQYRYDAGSTELVEFNDWTNTALWLGEQHAFAGDGMAHPSPAGSPQGRAPRTLEHAYVQGAALFARVAMLREVGVFDEVFHTYYEEVDLCRRARWAGWRVALLLDEGLQHHGGGGAATRSAYTRVHMRRNRYYYLLTDVDWHPTKATRLAARWLVADLVGRTVVGRVDPMTGARETLAAVRWLAGHAPTIAERRRSHRALRAGRTPARREVAS